MGIKGVVDLFFFFREVVRFRRRGRILCVIYKCKGLSCCFEDRLAGFLVFGEWRVEVGRNFSER